MIRTSNWRRHGRHLIRPLRDAYKIEHHLIPTLAAPANFEATRLFRDILVRNMVDQSILGAALEGLNAQRAKLEEHIGTVKRMLAGRNGTVRKPRTAAVAEDSEARSPRKKRRKKRILSPEARERIAAAQKKRWAAARKEKG